MNRRGFTLIELLAVMSVLAIVSTLSIPAWTRARSKARAAVCASNLRQMYTAYMSYLSDHDGELFPFLEQTSEGRLWYWGLERAAGGAEGNREIDRSRARLAPYMAGGTIETCPEFPYRMSFTKQKFEVNTYGYGLNHYLLRGTPANKSIALVNFTAAERLSHIIIWGDAAQVNTFQAPASPSNPMIEEWYYLSHLEATYHFRHEGKVQVIMGDGAVRQLAPYRLLRACDGQIGYLEPNRENDFLLPIR
ncbi:MAG: type II secretion system protein [Kiritimatiellae bacterium]|nr:type II secretion system protein [Kiritimatiellia bacterium]MCO5067918.1 type II secretion system GspH family protein [Kiritimatiellia bacterium]